VVFPVLSRPVTRRVTRLGRVVDFRREEERHWRVDRAEERMEVIVMWGRENGVVGLVRADRRNGAFAFVFST